MTNPSVRLRQIPEAGAMAVVFAVGALAGFLAVGMWAAEGKPVWTGFSVALALANLYWLQPELEEVSA